MPTLTEATSKFEISPELTRQEGRYVKVLRWLQNNKAQTRNTTFKQISEQALIPGLSTADILHSLQYLCRHQMITDNRTSNKGRKTIFINYLHKNLPQEIIEHAEEKDIDAVRKQLGIQEAMKYKAPELAKSTETKQEKPVEKEPVEVKTPEITIDKDTIKNGLSISFTINLNIK